MKRDVVKSFLKQLNAKNVEDAGLWVKASCPLAKWKHKSGHDKNPSFGIKVEALHASHFNCWACNSGGSLESLLFELLHLSKEDGGLSLAEAYKLVDADEVLSFQATEWSEFEVMGKGDKFKPWNEEYLNSFIPVQQSPTGSSYLLSRNVTIADIEYFDIRYDSSRKAVVFPVRSANGRLSGMRGRYIVPIETEHGLLRYHDYDSYDPNTKTKINNTKHVWYNEDKVDWSKTIVLTEAAFDLVAINHHYPNVMSPLSTGMSFEKIDRLKQAVKLLSFFDNDLAGNTAYEKIKKAVGTSTTIIKIEYPYQTPDSFDASDLPSDVVRNMLGNYLQLK